MSNNKKEQERAELHRTILGIANDLRGSVDGWGVKQNILDILFYRYISQNIANNINVGEHAPGNIDFDFASLEDGQAELIREEFEEGVPLWPEEQVVSIEIESMMT